MDDHSTDATALVLCALCPAVLAVYFCYLGLWVIPRKVRSSAYWFSLAGLLFCFWSLFAFVFLVCAADIACQGKHTRVVGMLWEVGVVLFYLDCFSMLVCLTAFVTGWLINRFKARPA